MTRVLLSCLWFACYVEIALAQAKPADDLLKGLPGAVSLPQFDVAAKPFLIGKTTVPADAVVAIDLYASEGASKLKGIGFQLEAEGDALTAREWIFKLVDARTSEKLPVAKLELNKTGALNFLWLPAARDAGQALSLQNCVVQISAGKSLKLIFLRKTLNLKPLELSIKESTSMKWGLTDPPALARLRVEVRPPKNFPRTRFIGSSTLKVSDQGTWLDFTDKEAQGMVRFHIQCEMRKQFEITAAPFLVLSDEKKIALTDAALKKIVRDGEAQQTRLQQQLTELTELIKKVPPPRRGVPSVNVSAMNASKQQLEKEVASVTATVNKVKSVQGFLEKLPDTATLSTRVFVETEKQPLNLIVAQ